MFFVGSPPRSMTSLALGSWLGFLLSGRSYVQLENCLILLRYVCHCDTTTVIMHCCGHRHHSWQGRTVGCFPPLEACMALSDNSFRAVPAQNPLGPVSEAHVAFSNRNFPYTSWRQPKATVHNALRYLHQT